jgi:hypothetical protein
LPRAVDVAGRVGATGERLRGAHGEVGGGAKLGEPADVTLDETTLGGVDGLG